MDSTIKFFAKCQDTAKVPRSDDIIIITATQKSTSLKQQPSPGTLLLVEDNIYFSKPNNKLYVRKLDFSIQAGLRVTIESTPKKKADAFHAYALYFQFGDHTIDFQMSHSQCLDWFEHLKEKVNCLEYHHFYEMGKQLGKGTFATVYIMTDKISNQVLATKSFFKKVLFARDQYAEQGIQNEITMMRKLNHPHILKLYSVFENKAQIYLMIEFAKGGTLETFCNKIGNVLPLQTAKLIFKQILEAVVYIHSNGIMHRDLKPANVLLKTIPTYSRQALLIETPQIMISDFGISCYANEQNRMYNRCGSPGYIAPEVISLPSGTTESNYDEKCDIFSLGCILYQLVTGKQLFQGKTADEIMQKNQSLNYCLATIKKELGELADVTIKMLSENPLNRPTAQQILFSPQYGFSDKEVEQQEKRPTSSPHKQHIPAQKGIEKKSMIIKLQTLDQHHNSGKKEDQQEKRNTKSPETGKLSRIVKSHLPSQQNSEKRSRKYS